MKYLKETRILLEQDLHNLLFRKRLHTWSWWHEGKRIILVEELEYMLDYNGFRREKRASNSFLAFERIRWWLTRCLHFVEVMILWKKISQKLEVCLVTIQRIFFLLIP